MWQGNTKQLKLAVKEARQCATRASFDHIVREGEEWCHKLDERDRHLKPLTSQLADIAKSAPSLDNREMLKQMLTDRVRKLQQMGIVHVAVDAGLTLLQTWEAEAGAAKELMAAIESKDLAELSAAIAYAEDTTFKDSLEVQHAIKLRDSNLKSQFESQLRAEIAKENQAKLEVLHICIDDCRRADCDPVIITEGEELLKTLEGSTVAATDDLRRSLRASLDTLQPFRRNHKAEQMQTLEEAAPKHEGELSADMDAGAQTLAVQAAESTTAKTAWAAKRREAVCPAAPADGVQVWAAALM